MAEKENLSMMVECQLRTFGLTDQQVLQAMEKVSRTAFVENDLCRAFAYLDREIMINAGDPARMMMAPASLAKLLQAAEIRPGQSVLVVGCGLGYSLAVLRHMQAEVYGIESIQGLVDRAPAAFERAGETPIAIHHAELTAGLPEQAPFDFILIEGTAAQVPDALFDQLAEGGKLLTYEGQDGHSQAVSYHKHSGAVSRLNLFEANAPFLPDFAREITFEF